MWSNMEDIWMCQSVLIRLMLSDIDNMWMCDLKTILIPPYVIRYGCVNQFSFVLMWFYMDDMCMFQLVLIRLMLSDIDDIWMCQLVLFRLMLSDIDNMTVYVWFENSVDSSYVIYIDDNWMCQSVLIRLMWSDIDNMWMCDLIGMIFWDVSISLGSSLCNLM